MQHSLPKYLVTCNCCCLENIINALAPSELCACTLCKISKCHPAKRRTGRRTDGWTGTCLFSYLHSAFIRHFITIINFACLKIIHFPHIYLYLDIRTRLENKQHIFLLNSFSILSSRSPSFIYFDGIFFVNTERNWIKKKIFIVNFVVVYLTFCMCLYIFESLFTLIKACCESNLKFKSGARRRLIDIKKNNTPNTMWTFESIRARFQPCFANLNLISNCI